jgi:hypothetical protein
LSQQRTVVEELEIQTEWLLQACKSKTKLPIKNGKIIRNSASLSHEQPTACLTISSSTPTRMVKRKRNRPQNKVPGRVVPATDSQSCTEHQAVQVIQSRARGFIVRNQRHQRIQVRINGLIIQLYNKSNSTGSEGLV